jgi:hypothetical protein
MSFMSKFDLPFKRSDDIPTEATAWERFLLGAGVPESNCASLLTGCTRRGSAIRVRQNYARRYVLEDILEALGLRKQLMLRWQRED